MGQYLTATIDDKNARLFRRYDVATTRNAKNFTALISLKRSSPIQATRRAQHEDVLEVQCLWSIVKLNGSGSRVCAHQRGRHDSCTLDSTNKRSMLVIPCCSTHGLTHALNPMILAC